MLKDYLPLCWFSGDAEDLPTDRRFLWINLGVYFCLGLFIQANISDPIEAFIQVIMECFITLFFIWAMLLKDGGLYNFERFLTAILVCENFIYTLSLPLAFWYIFTKESDFRMYPIYLGGVVILWSVAIIANLLASLFGFNRKVSLLWSCFYFLLTYVGVFMLLLMI